MFSPTVIVRACFVSVLLPLVLLTEVPISGTKDEKKLQPGQVFIAEETRNVSFTIKYAYLPPCYPR